MINKLKSIPLLQLAFRPFFLSGALFSILAIIIWIKAINGSLTIDYYSNSYWWHSHEMLFGFVALIISGFLLTAVQTWTGLPSINGIALLGLWLLWFIARIMLAVDMGFNKLFTWMKNNTTGNKRIRAGIPVTWSAGEKTGSGGSYGVANDIAVVWSSTCKPIVLSIYNTIQKKYEASRGCTCQSNQNRFRKFL